jgi:hypothetical protein
MLGIRVILSVVKKTLMPSIGGKKKTKFQ